jgi:DNA repair exonuclease SbcCD ATPase subunit
MGRADREYRRRQKKAQPAAAGSSEPSGERTISIPELRVQGWLDALQAAKLDREELQRLRDEIAHSRERIRDLESRLAELDRELAPPVVVRAR